MAEENEAYYLTCLLHNRHTTFCRYPEMYTLPLSRPVRGVLTLEQQSLDYLGKALVVLMQYWAPNGV